MDLDKFQSALERTTLKYYFIFTFNLIYTEENIFPLLELQ